MYYLFIFYILQYERKQYEILTSKTVVPIINKSKFSIISIPLPPLEEQKRIANILSDIQQEIEALEQKREKYKMIKSGLMQQLLTGKVRVK